MVADFNKKENREFFNKKLLFKTIGIIFLVVIIVLISADYKIYQKKQELALQINAYQKQIEDLKKSSQNLKDEIANSDNPDYLEKIAYEQLGEARPGETVYSFISSPEKIKTAQKPQNFWDIKLWSGWLSESWNWLKNKF